MIDFLIVFSTIIAVLLCVNFVFLNVIQKNNQEYQINRGKIGKWDYVSFGSAYCRFGLDFSDTNIKGFNFGYGSQFFYYTDKMLREYKRSYNEGCHVYIIVADLVFAEVGKGLYNAHKYFEILNKESLGDEYSRWKHFKSRYPVFFCIEPIKECIKQVLGMNRIDPYKSTYYNNLSDVQTEQAARQRCTAWCMQFGLKDTLTDDITPELEEIFKSTRNILTGMVQFCLDNGYKPYLVVTPVSKIMNVQLSDKFVKKVLYDNINMANIQNVPFFDYLRDKRFEDKDLYYNNADFLNTKGRNMFIKILLDDTLKFENRNRNIS